VKDKEPQEQYEIYYEKLTTTVSAVIRDHLKDEMQRLKAEIYHEDVEAI